MAYRPSTINELRTPAKLLKPTYTEYNGVRTPTYPADGDLIFVNFKTYGGTEQTVNGICSIIDTADVTTWYRPDITAGCRIKLASGAIYEIANEPENCDMLNQFCEFKVQRVKGGA